MSTAVVDPAVQFAPARTSEALLEAQKNVLEMIVQNVPLPAILGSLCRIVEDQAPGPVRAAILLVLPDGRRLTTGAAPSLPDSYSRAIDGIEISPFVGTCAAAAALRREVVTPDIAADAAWRPFRHLPLGLGLVAAWSMPIVSAQGSVLGTFGTYFLEKREPTEQERQLVEVLSRTAALAIERQKADAALHASERRYRAMIEASPECVKLVAENGTLLEMSAAGLRMIGAATESAVTGFSIYDVIAPEYRDAYRQFHEHICQGNRGALRFDIVGLDGTRRSVESTSVPLPSATGGYQQLSVTRDVTAQVQARRALEQSTARLAYAVQLSGIGFWYCDLPFDELVWDERVKGHFFMPPTARVTIADFYDRLHPDDRECTRHAIDEAIEKRQSYDVIYRTVNPADGAVKWIRALGGTQYAPDGTPVHFDGVTVDVTSQMMNEWRLGQLNEQLRAEDRRKDEFLATLAHELRNPLAPLSTGLQILKREEGAMQIARVREMMERQLGHLVHLVDDLLDVSRITLGKIRLQKERMDFRTALHSALEATRSLVESASHELAVRVTNQPFPMYADSTRLTQVVANLVNNAARYTPAGGRILLTAAEEDGVLVLNVSDTGVGMEPEVLARVFDMFVQAQPAGAGPQGGLGIGLTLVRRLVELHEGQVTAESAGLGHGSTFTVRLPLIEEPA